MYVDMKTKSGRPFKMVTTVDFEFVIEHSGLGIFRGFDRAKDGSGDFKPRWLRADRITRRSAEAWRTRSGTEAGEMMERVLDHHGDAVLVRMTARTVR